MKRLILLLFLVASISMQAKTNEIIAKVVFENKTDQNLISGRFFVADLNQSIEVNSENDFEITLPEKGKYQFSFYSEGFDSYTYYPAKITAKENVITIRLQEKGKDFNYSSKRLKYLEERSELLPKNFEIKKSEEYGMNFIIHSLNPESINSHNFQEKYGIGIVFKNCLIDPVAYKKAVEHNKYIVQYLEEKFEEENWANDLPVKPFGVK